MVEFLRGGGLPGYVVLVLVLAVGAYAIRFATRPDGRMLPMVRALSHAVVLTILGAVAANISSVALYVERMEGGNLAQTAWVGIGESLVPAIVGFPLLAIAWLFVAVGVRRLALDVG